MPLAAASPPVHLAKSSVPVLCFLMLLSPLPLAAQGNRSGGGITPMSKSNGITVFTSPTVLPTKLPSTGPFTQMFIVYNSKSSSKAVWFSCNAVGPVSCGGVPPSSGQIPGHGSKKVWVTYSTTAASGEADFPGRGRALPSVASRSYTADGENPALVSCNRLRGTVLPIASAWPPASRAVTGCLGWAGREPGISCRHPLCHGG